MLLYVILFFVNLNIPQEINSTYGYRTKFSTSNQDNWLIANTFYAKWANITMTLGFLLSILAYKINNLWFKMLALIFILLVTIITPILLTELHCS